jgi:hypothetical protein
MKSVQTSSFRRLRERFSEEREFTYRKPRLSTSSTRNMHDKFE